MDLARCLEDRLRMLTPLPRLERTGSSVGCSPAPRRPSPSGSRVGSSEKLSRPAQGSCAFRPAHLHLGCTEDFPRGFRGAISHLTCSSGYRANRQFPGRDFHPLAFETQEVSPSTTTSHLTSDLLSCRTARHLVPGPTGRETRARWTLRLACHESRTKDHRLAAVYSSQ